MNTPEPEVKRWTAKRKTQLVLEILTGKTTVAEAARRYDLKPSEIQYWVDEGIRGMENCLRARPRDIREQYEAKLKEAYASNSSLSCAKTRESLHSSVILINANAISFKEG